MLDSLSFLLPNNVTLNWLNPSIKSLASLPINPPLSPSVNLSILPVKNDLNLPKILSGLPSTLVPSDIMYGKPVKYDPTPFIVSWKNPFVLSIIPGLFLNLEIVFLIPLRASSINSVSLPNNILYT